MEKIVVIGAGNGSILGRGHGWGKLGDIYLYDILKISLPAVPRISIMHPLSCIDCLVTEPFPRGFPVPISW